MEYTPFAGLTALDTNDPITLDGGSFMTKNPRITDQLLRVGAVTHRHDQHLALPNPAAAPSGQVVASGGTLAASAAYAVTYTVVDKTGGETKAAPPVTLVTGTQVGAPTIAPQLALVTSAGILPAGNYYYALTYTDGDGGETTLGPQAVISVPPGFASASVVLQGLAQELGHPNGPVQWRLWRSYEGQDWHLVSQSSANSYDDAGFNPPDDPARPPLTNNTASTYSLAITLPTAAHEPAIASGTAINLYLAPDTSFSDPSFYQQVPIGSAGHTILIQSETTSTGSPPHVSTSLPGANQIYPDTDMVWALKSPVTTRQFLPSGAYGDMRVCIGNQHVYAVLGLQAKSYNDWTDLTQVANGGITIMGSGVGDAIWLNQLYENFQSSGASAQISDFANVGGAVMQVANGLLTTSDLTQTDAVIGALEGPDAQTLQIGTWGTRQGAPVSSVTGYLPAGARPKVVNQVNGGWPAVGLASPPPANATPVPQYTNPNYGSNQLGDELWINGAAYDSLYCTIYWWNGTQWMPQYVDASTGLGYSPAPGNWTAVNLRRPAARKPTVYGYQWTKPGQLADGYKLRARFRGFQHTFTYGEDSYDHQRVGLAFNLGSETQGLCFYVGINHSGWTTRPQDLVMDANNWPPESLRDGLRGWDFDFHTPALYQKELTPTGVLNAPGDDFWVEIWRVGNIAYAAVYNQDPATGVPPSFTSHFDTTGTPYAAGNAGYFGVVTNHIADTQVGFAELTAFKSVLLPTITLYDQQEIVFAASGGINLGITRAASGAAEVNISGGGVQLAASGGSGGVSPYETYIEFAGSGGAGVAIQQLGGGSARILIGAGAGGIGGGGGLAEISGSAGITPVTPVNDIEFAGSAGTAVSVQNLGGGSARVLISGGAAGPPGPPGQGGNMAVAGSGGVGIINPDGYLEFAGSGGTGVALQNLGGGSARVLISAQGGGGSSSTTPVGARATLGGATGSAQTIPTSAVTAISWGTTDYNYGGVWSSASPTRFTAPTAGFYAMDASVAWSNANTASRRAMYFAVNGEGVGKEAGSQINATTVNDTEGGISDTKWLNAGDYVELYVWQDTGGALNVQPANFTKTEMSVVLISAGAGPAGPGIAIAGSGGVGQLGPSESYIEFAGSGGTGVSVQSLGGGSARVVIGGGGGSLPARGAPYTYAGSALAIGIGTGLGNPYTNNFAQAVPVGTLAIAVVGIKNGTLSHTFSLTDSKGNTWTPAADSIAGMAGNNAPILAIFWSVITTALTTSDTLSVNNAQTTQNDISVAVHKFTPTGAVPAPIGDTRTGGGWVVPRLQIPVPPLGSGALLIGAGVTGQSGTGGDCAIDTTRSVGWTMLTDSQTGQNHTILYYKITAGYPDEWAVKMTDYTGACAMAAFA